MIPWLERIFCTYCSNSCFVKTSAVHQRIIASAVIRRSTIFSAFGIMGKTKGGFYAVARGRSVGIYSTWDECKAQVDGFQNARYKKFASHAEADQFISENKGTGGSSTGTAAPRNHANSGVAMGSAVKFDRKYSGKYAVGNNANAPKAASSSILLAQALPLPTSVAARTSAGQKRSFSTTQTLDRRKLKVTEQRVTNKRLKTEGRASNSGVDLKNFTMDQDGYVEVYTDGACTRNGQGGARAGIGVWFGDNHELNVSEPVRGRQTNNTAEIQAAERAISQAKSQGIDKLNVNTDSQFTINCATKWMDKWKDNDWTLSNGKPVANREDLEKLDTAMTGMDVKWSYVAGHRGHYGNEAADRLAVQGAEKK